MERVNYYKKLGWKKSPFIKSTSLDIPIISRVDEYTNVSEAIGGWDRIMVITAPIGYGKTTFMNQLCMEKPKGVKYIVSFNAYEPVEEVMKRIISVLPFWKRNFKNVDKTMFGEVLQKKLGKNKMLLIFDEAQDYEFELFKWLRILNDRCESLFMIFIGLGGLENKITAEASFRDRKSKSIKINPFELEDLEELIRQRIKWAGGRDIIPFTEGGLRRLCESSNKVPRLLLDNGQKIIEEAAKIDDFELTGNFVEKTLGAINRDIIEIPKINKKEVEKPAIKDFEVENEEIPQKNEEIEDNTEEIAVEMPYEPVKTPFTPSDGYDFMEDLSPTQQDIVKLLMSNESLSISELSQMLSKDIRSLGSLIRKLRGLNKKEVERKPNVPYPVIIRQGKDNRMGRNQYVYALSDNARRLLTKE